MATEVKETTLQGKEGLKSQVKGETCCCCNEEKQDAQVDTCCVTEAVEMTDECCSDHHHHHHHHHNGDEDDGCSCCAHVEHSSTYEKFKNVALGICGGTLGAMLIAEFFIHNETIALILGALSIVAGLYIVLPGTWASLKSRSIDINVLMIVAVIGATYVGALEEAAMVLFLFIVGEYLEGRATRKSGDAIQELAKLAPTQAQVIRNGRLMTVETDEIALGETVRIMPGVAAPLDGIITSGTSLFNDAAVTGESAPVRKIVGDTVYAAGIAVDGVCEIRTTSTVENSTLAKIAEMVRDARSRKSATETFVTRFARIYTPIVIVLACLVAFVPPILTFLGVAQLGDLQQWMYTACTLLVISCPCAFVISTPATVVSALARAARLGVLVKGGNFFESAAQVRAVAFDKTGTLTEGEPRVITVRPATDEITEGEIVCVAAALEFSSTHPLARAVIRYADIAQPASVTDFAEIAGSGVRGVIDGEEYVVGSLAFVKDSLDIHASDEFTSWMTETKTSVVCVARLGENPQFMGALEIADALRSDAQTTVAALQHGHPAKHVVMLTGDNAQVAGAVASAAGVDEFKASLLPQDKTAALAEISAQYGKVAFAGDGINDAPSVAAADVGIAMGGAGNDAVLSSADVVLMADDLRALPAFFDLSRKTVNIIRQNVTFALSIKVITMILAVMQLIPMWIAVFADSGLTVLVVANGMRLLHMKLK